MTTLFSRIAEGTLPARKVYEDQDVVAFWDHLPQRRVHILVVPRKVIKSLMEVEQKDEQLLGHCFWVAAQIAREMGLTEGYRLVVNTGKDGGQEVPHLHLHLLGGEPVGPMVVAKI